MIFFFLVHKNAFQMTGPMFRQIYLKLGQWAGESRDFFLNRNIRLFTLDHLDLKMFEIPVRVRLSRRYQNDNIILL